MNLPSLEKAKVFGKTVFLRADLDVPLSAISHPSTPLRTSQPSAISEIEDDTRLKAALPTIEYLLKNGAKVIIAGHLGRPKGIDKSLSLEPIARWFSIKYKVLSIKYGKRKGFDGWELTDNLFLLENLRFYKGEEANDQDFAAKLISLANIYVNDAFAVCHRAHASIAGMPKFLPHFAGIHLREEVRVLSSVLENPKRPLVVIIGGAKIETKLPLVEKMRGVADYVLVGGKIAKEILPFLKEKSQTLFVADLNPDGFDITPKSTDDFLKIVNTAETIVWNGPVVYVEIKEGLEGSRKLAEGIVKSNAYTVVGGGDTLGFLKKLGLLDKFSFVSTGGGAMLEFLSGKSLPGIIAIIS